MVKEFKCPICGCTEHFVIDGFKRNVAEGYGNQTTYKVKIALINYTEESYGEGGTSINFDVNGGIYLCKNCGHVDFFSEGLLETIQKHSKQIQEKIEILKFEYDRASKQYAELEGDLPKKKNRLLELDELLKSDEITVKQQKEYQNEYARVKDEISKDEKRLAPIARSIEDLQKEIDGLKGKLENVSKGDMFLNL